LQIWLFPNQEDVTPRYDQIVLDMPRTHNDFLQILSPNKDDDGVWIYQDAWMHLSSLDKGVSKEYHLKKEGNGVYIFVLKGEVDVEGTKLGARDGMGVWETDKVNLTALDNAEVLLIEVPMR
jgi:redox-sensitive bicupin YhaK (pirin superfamily)